MEEENNIIVEDMMKIYFRTPNKDFQDIIKKSVLLNGKNNMGIESIELCSFPEYLQCITLSFGKKNIFVWNRDDLTKYRDQNLLNKYEIKDLIPIFTHCYDQIKLNYIYNTEKIYKNCIIENEEIITRIAVEDTSKEVEYWDMDEQCACNAYGVKYIEEKSVKRVITKSPTLETPKMKIVYKKAIYDKNIIYKVSFNDVNIGCKNNLIVSNGNNYDIEF